MAVSLLRKFTKKQFEKQTDRCLLNSCVVYRKTLWMTPFQKMTVN